MAGPARGRRLASGLLVAALAAAALAAAACGPGDDSPQIKVYPDAVQGRIATLPDPTWRVAPLLEEQIFRSTTIVRATLQSAAAAVVAEPDDGGYRPVQELRFTTHEYLKGTGPATLLVAVRGGDTYATEAGARAAADFAIAGRVTTWDARQGVLFLRTAHPTYAPVGTGATDATVAAGALAFTLSNPSQSSWAYSVDTLSRAWLPATDPPAAGVTPTAFITDGAPTPPPTIALVDLRARIAALAAQLQTGDGIAGFANCIEGQILHARHRRAVPFVPPKEAATLASGAGVGTEVRRETFAYNEPQYNRYWLSGPDAALFQAVVIDDDGQSRTGYTDQVRTARPLPAGAYQLHPNLNYHEDFPCRFVPLDAYSEVTVTVTAPAGTVHEAFFDPAALGSGVVGRDAAHGVLAPGAVGDAAMPRPHAASTRGQREQYEVRHPAAVDLGRGAAAAGRGRHHPGRAAAGADPAGRHGGADAARRRRHAHGHGRRPRAALAGLYATLAAGRTPDAADPCRPRRVPRRPPRACPSAPALPTVTVDAATPAAGATATLTAAVPADGRRGDLPVATRRGRGVDAGRGRGRHLPGRAFTRHHRHLAGAGPLRLGGPGPLGAGHADLAGGGHGPCSNGVTVPNPHHQYRPGAGLHGLAAGARRAGRARPPQLGRHAGAERLDRGDRGRHAATGDRPAAGRAGPGRARCRRRWAT